MLAWPSSFAPLPLGLPPFILLRDNTSRSDNEKYSQRVCAISIIGDDECDIRRGRGVHGARILPSGIALIIHIFTTREPVSSTKEAIVRYFRSREAPFSRRAKRFRDTRENVQFSLYRTVIDSLYRSKKYLKKKNPNAARVITPIRARLAAFARRALIAGILIPSALSPPLADVSHFSVSEIYRPHRRG